jgi:hypothetical protein
LDETDLLTIYGELLDGKVVEGGMPEVEGEVMGEIGHHQSPQQFFALFLH